jgi:hypothetical protein
VDGNAPRWSSDVRQADWIAGRLSPWAGDTHLTGARDGCTSTGGATLTGGRDLREELTSSLTFEVFNLAGM